MSATTEQFRLVLNAADRHARELLNQASKYESLGMPTIVNETMELHYRPLKHAIEAVRSAQVTEATQEGVTVSAGERSITLCPYTRAVFVDGEAVRLTRLELALLHVLMRQPTRTFTQEELMTTVWNHRHLGTNTRTLTSCVMRLRRKIGAEFIVNVWGVGYRLLEAVPAPVAA